MKKILILIISHFIILNCYGSNNDQVFKNYSLHDFCLDITDETNRKNFDFLLNRIDFNSFEQAFSENTSINTFLSLNNSNLSIEDNAYNEIIRTVQNNMNLNSINYTTLLSNDIDTQIKFKAAFINKITTNTRKLLMSNLEYFAPSWKNTFFSLINENSAYCAITGDPFAGKDFNSYALLFTIEKKDQQFIISNMRDSNFFINLKDSYQNDSQELFYLSLSEIYKLNNYESSPLYMFISSAANKNIANTLSAYEYLSDEQKKNSLLLQILINTISSDPQTYNENIKIISKNLESNTPSYVLLNAYIDQSQFAQADMALKNLDNAFGYHPSHSFYNIVLDDLQHKNLTLKYLYDALNLDDGYEMTYWHVLNELVEKQKYDDSIIVLNILKKRFNNNFNNSAFLKNPTYKMLVKSKSFQQWKDSTP